MESDSDAAAAAAANGQIIIFSLSSSSFMVRVAFTVKYIPDTRDEPRPALLRVVR